MKANYRILAAGCLGFMIGFAIYYCLRIAEAEDPIETATSLSAIKAPLVSIPVPVSTSDQISNAPSPPELLGNPRITPSTPKRADEWRVTIWHPTFPPQKAGTFDVAQHVERTMRPSNR